MPAPDGRGLGGVVSATAPVLTPCQGKQQVAEWGAMCVTWPGWLFPAMLSAVVACWATPGGAVAAVPAVPVICCTDVSAAFLCCFAKELRWFRPDGKAGRSR